MTKLLLRVLVKLKLLQYININIKTVIHNRRWTIPIYAGIGGGNLYISEQWMLTVLEKLPMPTDKIFIDVGVNIGQTLMKVKSVYPDVEYIGFEPNSTCVFYCGLLVRANNLHKVSLIPAGISEKSSVVQLNYYTADTTDSCASIISDFREASSVVGKSFCACYHPSNMESVLVDKEISAIKIDVEGAELEVIKGFRDIIQSHRPNLLVEILPAYKPDSLRLERQQAIERILNELGYYMYRIHKDGNENFSHFEVIESINVHDRLDWCEYLFSPIMLNSKDKP